MGACKNADVDRCLLAMRQMQNFVLRLALLNQVSKIGRQNKPPRYTRRAKRPDLHRRKEPYQPKIQLRNCLDGRIWHSAMWSVPAQCRAISCRQTTTCVGVYVAAQSDKFTLRRDSRSQTLGSQHRLCPCCRTFQRLV